MPQMAPMWWTSLMIMFSSSYLLMVIMIFFNFKINMKKKINKNLIKNKWMW